MIRIFRLPVFEERDQFVLFGLGTLAFARHPEGLVDAFRGWRVARRERVALVVEEAGAAA